MLSAACHKNDLSGKALSSCRRLFPVGETRCPWSGWYGDARHVFRDTLIPDSISDRTPKKRILPTRNHIPDESLNADVGLTRIAIPA